MEETSQETGAETEVAAPQSNEVETQESAQDRQVPLSALEAERAKRHQMEEENKLIKEHMTLLQSQRSQPAQQEKSEWDGMDDGDVMTLGEFKKMSSKMASKFEGTLAEMKMQQKHPDYEEVITKYLPEVLKQNPGLRNSLEKSQDYELAYYLAKNCDSYRKETHKVKRSEDADRIIKNSAQSGTLSSMGASTPVKQAKRYKDMSDAEFRAVMHENLGY